MDVLERETFIIKLLVKSFSFLMYRCNKLQFTVEYNELSVYLWRFVVILYYFFES